MKCAGNSQGRRGDGHLPRRHRSGLQGGGEQGRGGKGQVKAPRLGEGEGDPADLPAPLYRLPRPVQGQFDAFSRQENRLRRPAQEHRRVRRRRTEGGRLRRDARGPAHVLEPSEALHRGDEVYDLRGFLEITDENNPNSGLYRFKKQFGGELVRLIGEVYFAYKPVTYALYRKAEKLYFAWRHIGTAIRRKSK